MRIRGSITILAAVLAAGFSTFLAGSFGSAASAASSRPKPIRLTSKVVVISRATVRRYLIGVSKDATTFEFWRLAGGLQRLRPGKVMLLQGSDAVAVTRVRHARGRVFVVTQPAKLTDVVSSGTIRYRGTPDARRAFLVRTDSLTSRVHGPIRFGAPSYPYVDGPASLTASTARAQTQSFTAQGSVGHYGYVLKFTPTSASRLDVSGVLCLQWGSVCSAGPSTGFSAEINITGYVDLGQEDIGVTVAGGSVTHSSIGISRLLAHAHLTYTLTSGTAKDIGDPPILRVPVGVDFPIAGPGGIPIYIKLQVAMLLKFGVASYNAAIRGGADVTAGGSDTIAQNGKQISGSESGDQAGGTILTHQAGDVGPSSSYLPSGVVVAFQFPKIGVGLGVRAANVIGYIDVVSSVGQTVSPAFGGLAGVDCSHYDLYVSISGGFEAQLGPLGYTTPSKDLLNPPYHRTSTEVGCPK